MRDRPANLRDRLLAGPVVGTFVGLSGAGSVEILGWGGFEVLCLDAEHSSFGVSDLQSMIRAADAVNTPSLVRVPELGQDLGRALDWGAAGVVVPRIETAHQAREAVSRVRYPPVGTRGAGPGRVTRYGLQMAEYLDEANGNVLLVLQVETVSGVANIAEIATVEGVDVIFVGPGDLAVSLAAATGSPEHTAAITRVLDVAKKNDVITGIFCSSPAEVQHYAALGVRLFLIGADVVFLAQGAQQALEAAHRAIAAAALESTKKETTR